MFTSYTDHKHLSQTIILKCVTVTGCVAVEAVETCCLGLVDLKIDAGDRMKTVVQEVVMSEGCNRGIKLKRVHNGVIMDTRKNVIGMFT